MELRERIVRAAARLLTEGGREAVSTRAVSAAAKVQAPAIYRQFGDMRDLLHAAARAVLATYVSEKTRAAPAADPVEELRRGWDLHIAFGLANPDAYALLYADPTTAGSPEARTGRAHLEALIGRVAEAGRLRVSVAQAANMVHAAGLGATLALATTPADERDPKLATAMREAVLAAILTTDKAPRTPKSDDRRAQLAARANGLRALASETDGLLSSGERQLLTEWLDRMAAAEPHDARVSSGRGANRRR